METTLHPLTIPFAQVTYDSIKPDIGGGRIGQVKKATLNDRSVALRFMKLLETGSIDEPELEKNNTTSAAVDDTQSPTAGASSAKLITDEFLSAEVARLKCGNGKNNQPRLVQFLGVYIPKDGYSFALVYEFMQRGGLDTFISKNRTGIQWETRISIILDLTEGMAWLHSRDALWLKPLDGGGGDALKSSNSSLTSINLNILQGWSIHGNLKSSNVLLCMEEGVMRAKISDIGLMEIKSKAISDYNRRRGIVEAKETDEAAVINPNSIYNAPELFHIPKLTKSSDVYSYGIVLLELSSLTKADDALYSFPHNIRNNEKIPDGIKAIIEQCLSLDPASRPTFQSINSTLRSPLQQTANNGPILTVLSITQSTLADRNISRQSSTVVIFNSVVTGEKQRQITTSPNTSVKDLKEISPQSIPNTTSPTGSNMQQQHQSMKKAPSNLKKAHSGSQGEVGSNNDVKSNPSTASRTNMSPLVPDMMAGLSPISGKMPEKSTGSSARALLHITHKRNGDGSGGGGGGVNASTSLGGSGAGQLDSFVSIQNSLIVEPIPKMERLKPASKERERDKDRDRYMGRSGADSSFAGASRGGGVPSINYSIHSAANSNFESKSIIDSEAEPQMLRMYGINSTTGQPDNKKRKLRAGAGNNNRGVAALRRSKKRPFRMNMAIVTCLVLAVAIIIIAVLVKFAKGSSSSSTSSNVADGAVSTLSTSSSVYTLSISTTLTAFTPTTSAIQTQT